NAPQPVTRHAGDDEDGQALADAMVDIFHGAGQVLGAAGDDDEPGDDDVQQAARDEAKAGPPDEFAFAGEVIGHGDLTPQCPLISLFRGLVVLGLLPGLRSGLLDRLDQATGLAAGAHRRAAAGAGVTNGSENLRFLTPRLTLLGRALRIQHIGDAIALTFGRANTDRVAGAGIRPEDQDLPL